MNDVKARMLNRRDLLRGAGAAGVAAATASFAAPAALAQGHGTVEDLTYELTEDFPTFFGDQQFFVERKFDVVTDGFNLFELRVNEHTGTHVDAPLHFSADGLSVAEIPVANLVVPLVVIDIRGKTEADPDAQVTPDDIAAFIAANGELPVRACVAMLSGWQAHFGTPKFRNADDAGAMHFPGFHVEAVQMLMDQTSAVGIASDTLSLDHGPSPDFAAHYAWLPSNRWGIECIANLDRLPPLGATLIVGAPKHRGGSGGPARILALV